MATPRTVFLQSKSLTAGQTTVLDAPTHPANKLLVGYIVRITGDFDSANAGGTTPTYIQWRDTIADTLFPNIFLQAPRYNNALCSGNLSGRYWWEMYETKYGRSIPAEWNNLPIDQNNTPAVTDAAQSLQIDFPIMFEEPRLGADRHWTCPPAHLFRGDVSLHITLPATLTVTVTDVLTLANPSVRWLAVCAHGDVARVPVVHRFEVRTVSSDSIDVGRGFPLYVIDRRAPGTTVSYDFITDGKNVNEGQVNGEDLMATYRTVMAPGLVAPETSVITPIKFTPEDATLNEVEFAARSFSMKLYGASSATLALQFAEPPNDSIKRNVALALGVNPVESDAPPVSSVTAPILHRKVALNGPRTLMRRVAGGRHAAPAGAAANVATVPPGTTGAAVASSMTRKR